MSDSSRWQRRSRIIRETDPSPAPTSKPPAPIILGLARPSMSVSHSQHHDQDQGAIAQSQSQTQGDSTSTSNVHPDAGNRTGGGGDKPVYLLKSRDENRSAAATNSASSVTVAAQVDSVAHQSHPPSILSAHSQPQRHTPASQQEPGKNRLNPPPVMKRSVQIIDEHLRWIDEGIDDLLDQTDFLVVGVVGLQGVGKSTILSLLAGNSAQDAYRSYIFQPEVKETREDAQHQTIGVDMFATPERIILLDTQPVFSASVMDYQNRQERKYSQEYTSLETCVEGESIKLISFMMTVCHVIIVAQEWFTDLTFLRSLLTAEMLRPQTHVGSHEGPQGSSHQDEPADFHPTIVFVQNKASQDDFTPQTYEDMKLTLHSIFHSTKMHYQGTVSMHRDGMISSTKAKEDGLFTDVNLFLLPTMEYYKAEAENILTSLPEYRGYPSFAFALRSLRNQIYSVPRQPMSASALSERTWFHFAARTWEAVKKSSLITEYNRLLP